jgi:hypothetical protein
LHYFGDSLTQDDYDRIALLRIPPAYRELEAQLVTLKWFDYRGIHPVKATYLLAHLFVRAIRDIHAKTKDYLEAKTLVVLDHEDIFNPGATKMPLDLPFWRARQEFDRVGVRYDFALNFVMNRAAARGWHVYPRPNQLYSEETVMDVKAAWEKHRLAVFQVAKDPRFELEKFSGHPDQLAYQQWLISECKRREHPSAALSFCFRAKHLNADLALPAFGDLAVREALRFAA